jgi:hypothetical protein
MLVAWPGDAGRVEGVTMRDYCVLAVDRGCWEKVLHVQAVSREAAVRCALAAGMVRVLNVIEGTGGRVVGKCPNGLGCQDSISRKCEMCSDDGELDLAEGNDAAMHMVQPLTRGNSDNDPERSDAAW